MNTSIDQVRGVAFRVYGLPAPQGSKRHVGNGVMVESSKAVKPWREDVRNAALDAVGSEWIPLDGAVELLVTFYFIRPKSAPKSRIYPSVQPDLSKLVRSTEDALTTAGVFTDDARITALSAVKQYGERAGADITVREVPA